MQRLAWLLAACLTLAFQLPASPCVAGATLASYEALGVTGCTIGPQTVDGFSFSVASVPRNSRPPSSMDELIMPSYTTSKPG